MIVTRRDVLYSEIRNKQRENIISNARMLVSKQQRVEILQSLIAASQQYIDNGQLNMLMKFVLRGQANAIIHLGNLLIDNVLTVDQIQNIINENLNKTVIQNENYMWLLHIIYGKNSFNEKFLLTLIDSINAKVKQAWKRNSVSNLGGKSVFCQHGLALLKKVICEHSSVVQLILETQNIDRCNQLAKSLIIICEASLDAHIITLCYSIINRLSFVDSTRTQNIISVMGEDNFKIMVKLGVLRVQSNIRCLSYQIMTNTVLCASQIYEEMIMESLSQAISIWQQQKTRVQVEISYLLLNCVKKFSFSSIRTLVNECQLLKQLAFFIQNCTHNQMLRNCCQILKCICSETGCIEVLQYYNQCSKYKTLLEKSQLILQNDIQFC